MKQEKLASDGQIENKKCQPATTITVLVVFILLGEKKAGLEGSFI